MRLSYQLYSSRNFPPLEDTIKLLSDNGVKEVEGFGGCYGEEPSITAELLAKHGVMMTSGHFGMETLEEEFDSCIKTATAFGMETIYAPYLLEEFRPTNSDGWSAIGLRLADIEKRVRDAGFNFGWHNHDFEYVKTEEGSYPIEHIFENSPTLEWEADLAWVIKGGADPLAEIKKYKDRITAVHIKDIAKDGECEDEDGWADVGHGTVDWKGCLAALKDAPVKHFILEHDNPSDHQRFITRSVKFLQGN